jgi:heme/copper-type cytochrome/quinol oxidase subunit 4
MRSSLINYAIGFLLAIVLETAVAAAIGYRKRIEIASVVCVNCFSYPLVNYLLWLVASLQSAPVGAPALLLFEVGVVIVEWLLLCYALPRHPRTRLLLLSLAMNSVSYFAGWFVPWA